MCILINYSEAGDLKFMLISYLVTSLNVGGAEMMLYRLLQKLNREKYEPVVVSLLPLGEIVKKIDSIGVRVYSLNMQTKFDITVLLKLYVLLKKLQPDILHTQLFHANFLGRIIGRAAGVPVIISSIRNTVFGGRFRELLIKWTDWCAMRTTTICKAAGYRMVEQGIVPANKLEVIYNGIEIKEYDNLISTEEKHQLLNEIGISDDRPLILAVGRLEQQKGYPYLLEAMRLLKLQGQPFFLAIAGRGKLKAELEKKVGEYGLQSEVCFLGVRDDVLRLMAVADMLVLSSIWEGLPGVVLEAMASGLPVVATAVGGSPELVIEGKTGFLVPPKDPVSLTESIAKVLSLSAEERLQMGQAARVRVKENFTLEKMVASYEELYKKCLQEKGLWMIRR